ncbi:MAG: hypothetical protein ABWZ53_11320 [Actinomycetota bacterium]
MTGTDLEVEVRLPSGRGNPVWKAAPTVLLRFRSLFAALAVGAFLVSVVATAYPLVVSASENELLASAIGNATVTPYGMGVAYRSNGVGFDQAFPGSGELIWQEREDVFTQEAARSAELGPTERAILGDVVTVTDRGGEPPASGPVEGRLFAGTSALAHVRVLSGADGPGVWLPDYVATPLRAEPGDHVILHSDSSEVRVAVDGVYASLYTRPRQGYWRLWNDQIYPCPEITCSAPPQFILSDLDRMQPLSEALGFSRATFAWQAPAVTDPPLTLTQASRLAAFSDGLKRRMSVGAPLFRLFRCCGRTFHRGGSSDVTFTGNADLVVQQVEQRIAAVQGPMVVLLVAGLAIALAVVATAGVFVVLGRRVEMGVLTIRGWGPLAFGSRAALETVLPALIGGGAGFAVALAVVTWAGPAASASSQARAAALAAAIAGTIISIVAVGVVSGVAFVSRHEHRHRIARVIVALPWELAAFAAAWALARSLSEGGVVESGGIQRPQPAVFLFPLALALGVGILTARLARFALRRVRSRGSGVTSSWLAVRRLRSSPGLTSLFLVAGILTLSVSGAALATVASLRTTVEAKAKVFVGSQVQVQVGRDAEVVSGYGFPLTMVTRFREAGSIDDLETTFDLLLVDPETFASAAYWNDAFSDDPLPTLLDRLSTPREDGAVPVVVANGGGLAPDSITVGQHRVPVSPVGTASTFPGTSSDTRPLLVMDRNALETAFRGVPDPLATPRAITEIWIDGPSREVVESIDELGVFPLLVITAEEVQDVPFIDAAVQTFLVLQVLGFAAVALLVVVAVVYLNARQRGRAVATTLSDRMGMPRSTMRTASVIELGALLLVAAVIGTAAGLASASVVVPSLDPLPSIPPEPLIVWPLAASFVTFLCLAAAALAGGSSADRGARRSSVAEVMRVAE